MSYGILKVGQNTRKQALQGMGNAAQMEAQREAQQKQLDAQRQAARQQAAGTATGMGLAGLMIALF